MESIARQPSLHMPVTIGALLTSAPFYFIVVLEVCSMNEKDIRKILSWIPTAASRLERLGKEKERLQDKCKPWLKDTGIQAALNEILRGIDKQAARIINDRDKATALIMACNDKDTRAILGYRFIEGRPWWYVANRTHYSIETCHRKTTRALKEMAAAGVAL